MSVGASSHLKKSSSTENAKAATHKINILSGKVRQVLEGVTKREGDAAVAAYRISGMTQNWIKSNYVAATTYQKLEEKGPNDVEHISGDKILVPKTGPISTIKPDSRTEEISGEELDAIVREAHKH